MICYVILCFIVSVLFFDRTAINIHFKTRSRISVFYFISCRIAFQIHFFFLNQSINQLSNELTNQPTNHYLWSLPAPLQRYAADAAVRYGYAESKGLDLPELCARATKHNLDAEVICNSIPSSINLGIVCVVMLSTQSSALLLLYHALL